MDKIKRRSSAGFSLVEVMIAMALLGVSLAAVASLIAQANKQKLYAEKKAASLALASQIIENLRLPETCDRSLGSASGSLQTVNEASLQQEGTTGTNGWQIELTLTGIQSGANMSGTRLSAAPPDNIIPGRRLKIDSLKLADGHRLPDAGVNHRYIANVYLKTSELGGFQFKDMTIGSTTIVIDKVTSQVIACGSVKSSAFSSACSEMGCVWDPAQSPPCRCKRSQVVCAAPGAVPVSFSTGGYPNCVQAGGDMSCPGGEYLAGFGIGYLECVALPTTAVASATPTISPTPSPIPTSSPASTCDAAAGPFACPLGTSITHCGSGAFGCSIGAGYDASSPSNPCVATFLGFNCPAGYDGPATDISSGSCTLMRCSH